MQLDEQTIEQRSHDRSLEVSLHTYIFDQINFTKLISNSIILTTIFSLIIINLESTLSLVAHKTKTIV